MNITPMPSLSLPQPKGGAESTCLRAETRTPPRLGSPIAQGGGAHLEITSSNTPLRGSSIHNLRLQCTIQCHTGKHTAFSQQSQHKKERYRSISSRMTSG